MPTISRRKTKQSKKKNKPLNLPNQHSSATVQLQTKGPFVSENHSKMEGNFNGTLHDTQKVKEEEEEEESLSEDKEVTVEVSAADDDEGGDYYGKSESRNDITDVVDIDEHVESCKVVEEEENVSETVGESVKSSDAIEANRVENIVDSETVEANEDSISLEDNDVVEGTELVTSKENNEGLRESEVVETVKDTTVGEDENVLSSLPSTDVVSSSREVFLEKSDPKSDDVDDDDDVEKVVSKGTVEPLVKSKYEKDEEQLDIHESSAYESAKESLQPSSNVHDSENNSVNEQDRVEESRGIENQGSIFSVTQRQPTSWKNCCGLFEILRHGDR